MKILFLVIIVLCFSSCQVGRKYKPPIIQVPEAWKHQVANPDVEALLDRQNWWEIFNDDQLNYLEYLAFENNHNLYIAAERVMQARALAGIVDSNLYPQVNLEPSYINREILWMLFDPVRIIREHRRRNELPIIVNYEVDLWGKLRKASEAAFLNLEAEEGNFQTAMLILSTELASSYYRIRTLDAALFLLQATIEVRKKTYELMNTRYLGKIISQADVSRAKLEYADAKTEYDQVFNAREIEENKLAVLIGLAASEFKIEPTPLRGIPPLVPAGMPSNLLIQRPDITAAERRMASNHALAGAAYASFFPSISLTGGLGFSSPELKDFLKWKSRLIAIGANLTQMIFDGGKLYSDFQLALSKFREADQAYRQIVLIAFEEVEDALSTIEQLNIAYYDREEAVQAAQNVYNISSVKYEKGATFYLDVVDSEREKLRTELDYIELLGQRFQATIQLIKALGGSWCNSL